MDVIFRDVDNGVGADGLLAAVDQQFARAFADPVNFLGAVAMGRQSGAGGNCSTPRERPWLGVRS